MASIETIGKAQVLGAAIQKVAGQPVSYIYKDDHVRMYFEPDRLKSVQSKLNEIATSGPGEIRFDWMPIITPMIVKKTVPVAIGLLVAGFIFGKLK